MAIHNRCIACLFYLVFLISSNSFASSNLRDWTFNSSGQLILHIDASTQYNNELYARSITLDNNISNHKAYILSIVKNRLFRVNDGFNFSSISSLHSKLLEQNWVIDNSKRIIYKDVFPNRECSYFDSNHELVDFTAHGIAKFPCPKAAIDALSSYNALQYTPKRVYTWNGWSSEAINHSDNLVSAIYMFEQDGSTYYDQLSLERISVHNKLVLPKRIFMTESQLFQFILDCDCFDIMNAYKALTNYEKINNQGYLYLTNRLMPSEPTVTDIVLPDDGNTGGGNTGGNTGGGNTGGGNTGGNTGGDGSQSSFCTTFSTVCDFIDWFKKDPDSSSDENVSIKDHGTESYNHYWTEYFNVSPMCPRPHIIDFTIDLKVTQQRFYYQFEYTQMCSYAQQLRPFFLFAAYVACAMIVAGVRNG
jgi:uncharacterized membrane protein YgcG